MDLEEEFRQSASRIKSRDTMPSDEDLLILYGLYKQATIGDVNTEKPSFLNFKEVSKWNAWSGLKGMQKIQAQGNYIKHVKDLQIKYQK